MTNVLDSVKGIPFFTNCSDQAFGWYAIYNDGAIILELNKFSVVSFLDIPKSNLIHLGLFGNGLHLNCDFLMNSLSFYVQTSNKAFKYEECLSVYEDSLCTKNVATTIEPFQFKGFVFDSGYGSSEFMINAHYLGYNMIGKGFKVKRYFSIDKLKYPNSIGIITKYASTIDYPDDKIYRLLVTKNRIIENNGKQEKTSEYTTLTCKTTYTHKTILSY